jgi:hypothetical protein
VDVPEMLWTVHVEGNIVKKIQMIVNKMSGSEVYVKH